MQAAQDLSTKLGRSAAKGAARGRRCMPSPGAQNPKWSKFNCHLTHASSATSVMHCLQSAAREAEIAERERKLGALMKEGPARRKAAKVGKCVLLGNVWLQ